MKISVDIFCKIATKRLGDWAAGWPGASANPIPPHLLVSPSCRLLVILFLFSPVFMAACGKVGGPLPPIVRAPLHVETLGVEQRGAHLILKFPFTRESRAKLQRLDVYRLV